MGWPRAIACSRTQGRCSCYRGMPAVSAIPNARLRFCRACVATLDNLLKGAATQALQNLNLAFGIAETAGIPL